MVEAGSALRCAFKVFDGEDTSFGSVNAEVGCSGSSLLGACSGVPLSPNWPIFFSQPIISGSCPPAQSTWISFNPFPAIPLAQTAANAPRICVKGTTAMPRLGFFGGEGFNETRIDEESRGPKGERSGIKLAAVVSSGCEERAYFTRTVVSK